MFYFIFYIVMTVLAVCCSIPIINTTDITIYIVLADWFSFMTYCGVLCGVFLILRPLIKIHFNPNSRIYQIPAWEQKLYKKARVDRLSNIIPDFSFLVNFKKKVNTSQAYNSEFYKKFIYENVCGSWLHFCSTMFAPLFFFFIHKELYITVGLIGMLTVINLGLLPVILQRSTRARLLVVYNKCLEREAKIKDQN